MMKIVKLNFSLFIISVVEVKTREKFEFENWNPEAVSNYE